MVVARVRRYRKSRLSSCLGRELKKTTDVLERVIVGRTVARRNAKQKSAHSHERMITWVLIGNVSSIPILSKNGCVRWDYSAAGLKDNARILTGAFSGIELPRGVAVGQRLASFRRQSCAKLVLLGCLAHSEILSLQESPFRCLMRRLSFTGFVAKGILGRHAMAHATAQVLGLVECKLPLIGEVAEWSKAPVC